VEEGRPQSRAIRLSLRRGGRFVNVEATITTNDPTVLTLEATLLDPSGNPLPFQRILFVADFPDATFIPGSDNQSSVLTDDNGQVQVTLIAGLTTGRMSIVVEALGLNIAFGISVDLTNQGFISLGDLGIIPAAVTFVNPLVGSDSDGPMTIFNAVGGTPPYRWDNSNIDLGIITPKGLPNVNERAEYALISPIPTGEALALEDTITLLDAAAGQANATVTVIFADCTLMADGTMVTLIGVSGAQFQVDVSDGVPPFSVTETFPGSVNVEVVVIDVNGNIIPGETCDTTGERCVVILTLPDLPFEVAPDEILIRDARGCTAQIELTVTLCGNGVVDLGEECDGPVSGTCEDFLGAGATGELFCDDTCTFDTSNCQEPIMMM